MCPLGIFSVYAIWDCRCNFKNDTDKSRDRISPFSFLDDTIALQSQSFQGFMIKRAVISYWHSYFLLRKKPKWTIIFQTSNFCPVFSRLSRHSIACWPYRSRYRNTNHHLIIVDWVIACWPYRSRYRNYQVINDTGKDFYIACWPYRSRYRNYIQYRQC